MPAVLVDGLTKRWGARVALRGVSFTVERGEIVGLLGPNGAGKSTTLGVLATQLPFDRGRVVIADRELPRDAGAARRVVGLVPQQIALYPTLSAEENLRFFGRAAGLTAAAAAVAAATALARFGLAERAREPIARLSVGMRRRLNLACGILHAPAIVLLDEPVVGVDPQSRERIFAAVQELARGGAAVVYSTHQMEEAERLCGRIVLLDGGEVRAAGTPAALVAATGLVPHVRLRTIRSLGPGWLDGVAGARVVTLADGACDVALADASAVPAVLAAADRGGGRLVEFQVVRPNLADAFLALTGHALRDDDLA
ncbi:MAG TPA: ABC transporter ATP-binding protein [Candidatus Binatia bacterium]|nr:ABC transporter ATP-binding protein [Candidatus Binatia bacterium]